jgi:hypothetical protein
MKTWKQKISLLALVAAAWVLNQPSIQTARADSFGSVGGMVYPTGFSEGEATLLSNGMALVVGDFGCELFDPATGLWTAPGAMSVHHAYAQLTSLANGKALIEGGNSDNGDDTTIAELFNPTSETWTTTGSLNTKRQDFTATLLTNGKVLVVGGINFTNINGSSVHIYLSSAELYDPVAGTWTATGSLHNGRERHTATLLTNGKVLVTGGYNGGGSLFNSAELYDPATGTWTVTGSLNTARENPTATLLPNGEVLVAGGDNFSFYLTDAELYNPTNGTWTVTGSMASVHGAGTATLLPNGQVLVAGGTYGGIFFESPVTTPSAELYNPTNGTWMSAAPMIDPRWNHIAVLLSNGQVLVAGGRIWTNYFSSAELYGSVGFLMVTLSPAGAVSAGAQWQVDGGLWQNSGAVVTNLAAGNHTVVFTNVTGWITPSNQIVSITANITNTTITGTYTTVSTVGALQEIINPAGAVSAGAQWQVDGGAFQNSGDIVTNLSVGNHTVSFNTVTGWVTPSNQTVAVSANTTNATFATYTQIGALQVTISPPGAVSAGAQWQVDGGAFQNSGAVVTNLSVGSHTVAFSTVTGWVTPASQIVPIIANITNTASGTYTQVGAVKVTINPPGVVSAGAQWQVDGGDFQSSGAIVTGLSLGNHTVSFKTIFGWLTPSNQTVTVSANSTNTASATYTSIPGALQVTINPPCAVIAGAQWQVDGGAFQNSGAIVTNLSNGNHTVSFTSVVGWITPSNQTLMVTANITNTTTGTYIQTSIPGTITWINVGGGNVNWSTATNWDLNRAPTNGDIVLIPNTGGSTCLMDVDATVAGLVIGECAGSGSDGLNLNGHILEVDGPITVKSNAVFAITSGTLLGNSNTIIGGVLGWTAGTLGGTFTIATNSTLLMTGTTHPMANTILTNNGTVAWSAGGIAGGGIPGTLIYNNGLWDSQGDLGMYGGYGGNSIVFNNAGTFRKSAGTGQTVFGFNGVFLNNTGNLDAQTGVIALDAGGNFTGGTATNLAGIVQLAGGNFTVNGTITTTNVQMVGGSLTGTNVFTNGFNWAGGDWNTASPVTITPNTLLLLMTGTTHQMANTILTNNGTVAWSGGGIAGGGIPGTLIYNNGLWDSQEDLGMYGGYGGNSIVFNNAGTFRKSAGTGQTVFGFNGVFLNNTGNLDAQTGVIALDAGGNFTGGTATNLAGIVQLAGGMFNINGTITTTNVQMVGGSLTGTNVFTNGFNWAGGDWNTASPVTIAPNTLLLMTGGGYHAMENTLLTNNGTVAWSAGDITGGGAPGTLIYNNGLWDSQGDLGMYGGYGGNSIVFNNAGTFRKSAGTGQTVFAYNGVFLNNTGNLDAQTGVIALASGGNFTGGTLNFGLNSSNNYGQISFSGAMALTGTVSANLNNGFIPAASNSFSVLSYGSETGSFSSTVLPPGSVWTSLYGATTYTITVVSNLPAGPINNLVAKWQSGQALLQFSGASNASYTVLSTTNLTVPRTNWNTLGQAAQQSGGIFQYLDNQTPGYPQRFYQIRSP